MILFLEKHYGKTFLSIILLALVIRILSINPFGLWFDEQCSMRGALGFYSSIPLAEASISSEIFTAKYYHDQTRLQSVIPATMQTDRSNGIIHNLFSFAWIQVFGRSDLAVRSSSVLFNMIGLIVLMIGSNILFGRSTALLAGLLFSVHPAVVRYAIEFRPYSLVIVGVLLSTITIYKIVERAQKNQTNSGLVLLYLAFFIGTFFSHYLSAYVFLGHAIFCLLYLREKKTWALLLSSVFIFIILFYFWLQLGAAEALSVLKEHSELWARRQIEQGGFTFKLLLEEIKLVLPKIFGLNSFTGPMSSGSKINSIFEVLKLLGSLSLTAILVHFYMKKLKLKSKMAVHLCLSIILSCFVYSIFSSVQSRHFLPFIDRYILFSIVIGMLLFSHFIISFLEQSSSVLWQRVAIFCFLAQVLLGFGKVASEARNNKSYIWANKNIFIPAAVEISIYDPDQYDLILPSKNIANLLNVYLPSNLKIQQQIIIPEGPKNMFVRHKITGEIKNIITDIYE